jgi:hypothetical protein
VQLSYLSQPSPRRHRVSDVRRLSVTRTSDPLGQVITSGLCLKWDQLPACHVCQGAWSFCKSLPGWKLSPPGNSDSEHSSRPGRLNSRESQAGTQCVRHGTCIHMVTVKQQLSEFTGNPQVGDEQLFEFMHRGQLRIVYDALARHTGRVNLCMLQQGAVISTSCLPVQVV